MNRNKHGSISGMRANKYPYRRRHGSKSYLPATRIYTYKCWRVRFWSWSYSCIMMKIWKYVHTSNKSKIKTWTFISIYDHLQTRWFEWVTDVDMASSNKSFQPNWGVNRTLIHDFGPVYQRRHGGLEHGKFSKSNSKWPWPRWIGRSFRHFPEPPRWFLTMNRRPKSFLGIWQGYVSIWTPSKNGRIEIDRLPPHACRRRRPSGRFSHWDLMQTSLRFR